MNNPQTMLYDEIVCELEKLSKSDPHGERTLDLARERIDRIDIMMDLPRFNSTNGQQLNKPEIISEEDRDNGRKLMEILHTDPSVVLAKSKSYHQKMKEKLDKGDFEDDIQLAVETFLNYVSEKETNQKSRIVILPVCGASFRVEPGFFDKDLNEVHFNNISGVCVDEESLRTFLRKRLT